MGEVMGDEFLGSFETCVVKENASFHA